MIKNKSKVKPNRVSNKKNYIVVMPLFIIAITFYNITRYSLVSTDFFC